MTHRLAACLLLAAAGACWAQGGAGGTFRGAQPDAGWVLAGAAALTAPAIDTAGQGWLRLTPATAGASGIARFEGAALDVSRGLVLSLEYAAWGGAPPGGDGIAVVLYQGGTNPAAAPPVPGLGYCNVAGGWFALALDESGGFSNAADVCGNGPGVRPQSIAIRGPVANGQPLMIQEPLPPADGAVATQRPAPGRLRVQLVPLQQGFVVSVDRFEAGAFKRIVERAPFPFRAPGPLRLALVGTSGAARNVHEVRDVVLRPLVPVTVTHSFQPSTLRVGEGTTLTVSFEAPARTALQRPLVLKLPPGLKVSNPPGLSGDCRGAVQARPDGDAVVIEADTAIGTGKCGLLFELNAVSAGRWTSEIPAGALHADAATNLGASQAPIVVNP